MSKRTEGSIVLYLACLAVAIAACAFGLWREYQIMVNVFGWSVETAKTLTVLTGASMVGTIALGFWFDS